MVAKKGGLGRGFDAIMMDNSLDGQNSTVTLKLSEIEPNREQPRKQFNDESLAELCDSIREHGVIQPLLVRPISDGGYQLVAGERRWRASRMAGLTEVPVVIREMSDQEMMTIALIENLQRENLSPMEEAEGYQSLIDQYGMTQEEVSKVVGKSRPTIANSMRLLSLPPAIKKYVAEGKLSAGHGRTILAVKDHLKQIELAEYAIKNEISVRQIEKMANDYNKDTKSSEKTVKPPKRSIFFEEVELALNEHLGRKVSIKGKSGKGTLQIEFYNEQDLADLAERLGREY